MTSGNLTKAGFARDRGFTRQHVNRLVREGLPVQPDGLINRQKARAWLAKHRVGLRDPAGSPSVAAARLRKLAARVAALLRKVDALEQSTISVADFHACHRETCTADAGATMQLASALAPMLVGRSSDDVHAVLSKAIHDFLTQSADAKTRQADDLDAAEPPRGRRRLPTSEAKLTALKLETEAHRLEIQNALATGELQGCAAAEVWIFNRVRGSRDRLQATPSRIAPLLAVAKDADAAFALLADEFATALDALDGGGFVARRVPAVVAALRRVGKGA